MYSILKKLGLKEQTPFLIINAPEEYYAVMNEIQSEVYTKGKTKYNFILVFLRDLSVTEKLIEQSVKLLDSDGHYWLCYPKRNSKKYKSDINRETTWELLVPYNFEPVTQIAIDNDWTTMRFRSVDYIKMMKRKFAVSE